MGPTIWKFNLKNVATLSSKANCCHFYRYINKTTISLKRKNGLKSFMNEMTSLCPCFVISTFHYRTSAFSSSYYAIFTVHRITVFHHRIIRFSPSYYRVFTIVVRVFVIVLSTFHYRSIAFLPDMRTEIISMDESISSKIRW